MCFVALFDPQKLADISHDEDNHKCDDIDNGNIIGEEYCPVSCDECPWHPQSATISVDADCYEYGETIKFQFTNPDPKNDDWVGIYEYNSNFDPNDLGGDPILWFWLCDGDLHDFCKALYGEREFDSNSPDPYNDWPLDEGQYIVVLARDHPTDYRSYAESHHFEVKRSGQSCGCWRTIEAKSHWLRMKSCLLHSSTFAW